MIDKMIKCPLCYSVDKSESLVHYPGSFLRCDELLQCLECNLIFANPLPLKQELDQYYVTGLYYDKVIDPYYDEILTLSLDLAKSRIKLISNFVDFDSVSKIIDIGAGNAQFLVALSKMNHLCAYDVVEPDEGVSSQYGELVNEHYSYINQARKNTYDIAVLNQVLEHVADPVGLLSSVADLIIKRGYIYIDVPYQDYIFKPSVEPHILFWSHKSIALLVKKTGFKVLFCETAGMPHNVAQRFFHPQTFMQKLTNPWIYQEKINGLFKKSGLPKPFNTFHRFQSDCYGGDRQWLRLIAQKWN